MCMYYFLIQFICVFTCRTDDISSLPRRLDYKTLVPPTVTRVGGGEAQDDDGDVQEVTIETFPISKLILSQVGLKEAVAGHVSLFIPFANIHPS